MVCGLGSTADPTVRQLFSSCVEIASLHVVASQTSMRAKRRRCTRDKEKMESGNDCDQWEAWLVPHTHAHSSDRALTVPWVVPCRNPHLTRDLT